MKGVKGFQMGHETSEETRRKISEALSRRVYFNCQYCGEESYDKPSSYNKKKRHYCSRSCYSADKRENWKPEEMQSYKGGGIGQEERRRRAKCRSDANHAIEQGRLDRSACETCGEENAEAHHDDYDKPLDVRWLCFKHHREHHRENPELLETRK